MANGVQFPAVARNDVVRERFIPGVRGIPRQSNPVARLDSRVSGRRKSPVGLLKPVRPPVLGPPAERFPCATLLGGQRVLPDLGGSVILYELTPRGVFVDFTDADDERVNARRGQRVFDQRLARQRLGADEPDDVGGRL